MKRKRYDSTFYVISGQLANKDKWSCFFVKAKTLADTWLHVEDGEGLSHYSMDTNFLSPLDYDSLPSGNIAPKTLYAVSHLNMLHPVEEEANISHVTEDSWLEFKIKIVKILEKQFLTWRLKFPVLYVWRDPSLPPLLTWSLWWCTDCQCFLPYTGLFYDPCTQFLNLW